MWHSFITCSEALKINISYLNLEPDNIWIYSIQNELPQSLSLCCILKCGGFWFCFLPSFPLISFLFGSPISNVIMFVRLEDDFFGFYFLTNLFFLEFGNFIHVHFQSFCHFEISKIIVFSLLESLVPMWLEKFWSLKGCSHFYWALHNHRWFWLYSLVRISSFTIIRGLL